MGHHGQGVEGDSAVAGGVGISRGAMVGQLPGFVLEGAVLSSYLLKGVISSEWL